jgi:hypothetical protein
MLDGVTPRDTSYPPKEAYRMAERVKTASFSIRMRPEERASIDRVAGLYNRPRSWIIMKTQGTFLRLLRARKAKTLTNDESACLGVLEKGLRAPVNPRDEE